MGFVRPGYGSHGTLVTLLIQLYIILIAEVTQHLLTIHEHPQLIRVTPIPINQQIGNSHIAIGIGIIFMDISQNIYDNFSLI